MMRVPVFPAVRHSGYSEPRFRFLFPPRRRRPRARKQWRSNRASGTTVRESFPPDGSDGRSGSLPRTTGILQYRRWRIQGFLPVECRRLASV